MKHNIGYNFKYVVADVCKVGTAECTSFSFLIYAKGTDFTACPFLIYKKNYIVLCIPVDCFCLNLQPYVGSIAVGAEALITVITKALNFVFSGCIFR